MNCKDWAAPTFCIPDKNKVVREGSDFRTLNRQSKGAHDQGHKLYHSTKSNFKPALLPYTAVHTALKIV